jgi:small-conductance mechanosensitive channel
MHVDTAGRIARIVRRHLAVGLVVTLCGVAGARAQDAAAPAAQSPATTQSALEPAELRIANRPIVVLRAGAFGGTPADRVRAIEAAVPPIIERGGPLTVTTAQTPEGILVLVDGMLLFRVLNGDVDAERGETPQVLAAAATDKLELALAERREARDSTALLPAILYSLAATLVAALLVWLTWRGFRWAAGRLRALARRRSEQLASSWGRSVLGSHGLERIVVAPLQVVAVAVAALVLYQWLAYVLEQFPYTRPWGEALYDNLADAVGELARGIAQALPGLFFVAVIFYLTRTVTRVVRGFFTSVEEGRLHLAWVDETTARPTSRLINAVVWLFGFVAAYPYIPGSESEAFKGIGVFVGLMLSIGSSGIVNQAVSGLMLMYTRALKPGEFVQIGETEGIVRSVGFVNTRLETLRHEEISIPNSVIAGTMTRNFSRLAREGGVRLPTQVTIGYDTPWRQVRALLLLAAERSRSISRSPEPRVLQTALNDFYVEYTLLVSVEDPAQRLAVLDELHANIQDVFNEHGVQIMSPHYEADPAGAKLVPQEEWFRPPARR